MRTRTVIGGLQEEEDLSVLLILEHPGCYGPIQQASELGRTVSAMYRIRRTVGRNLDRIRVT